MRRIIRHMPQRLHPIKQTSNCARQLSASAQISSEHGSVRHFSTRLCKHSPPSYLSPFLIADHETSASVNMEEKVDVAFLGLLKAMSGLKASPDVSDQNVFNLLNRNAFENRVVTEPVKMIPRETTVARKPDMKNKAHAEERAAPETKQKKESQAAKKPKRKLPLSQQIQKAIAAKRVNEVIDLLEESMMSPQQNLNDHLLGRVIHFLSFRDLRAGFETVKFLVQRSKDQGKIVNLPVYRCIIRGIFHASYYMKGYDMRDLGDEIYYHIRDSFPVGSTSAVYQHILLPMLVCELAKHSDIRVVQGTKAMVDYMIDEEFPVLNPELYEAILNEASPGRVGHLYLPYHKLLSELVSRGYKPHPSTVYNVLLSYYPYGDSDATYEILQAIRTLAQDSSDYAIDIGTLESISMTTKQSQHTDLNVLIWDLAELFSYEPTECMFEDVVLSFGSTWQDKSSIKALLDMERSGYTPSYVFLRQYALQLSTTQKRLAHAQNLVTYNEDGQYLSASSMNCLLLGFGMRKDLDKAFEVFEGFVTYNLKTDENTFAFLMESLCLNVKDRVVNEEDVDDILGIVETIMESMNLAGVDKSSKVLYEHIRILCILKRVDDARKILEKAIVDRLEVKPGTVVMIANGYLDAGDTRKARDVANLSVNAGCGEPPTYLLKRIANREEEQAEIAN